MPSLSHRPRGPATPSASTHTDLGAVADASDAEHDSAFLQHDVYAEAVMHFFLRHFGCARAFESRGVLVVVYTRWDSAVLDP